MTRAVIGIALLTAATAAPASAEHRTFESAGRDAVTAVGEGVGAGSSPATDDGRDDRRDLDLQLKLGADGFRLGGRVTGPEGVAGAWLNGRMGDRAVHVDGRVQRADGRAWNFWLEADLDGLWPRFAWRLIPRPPVQVLDFR